MARRCEICGKGVRSGRSIVRHGMPKVKGGIGLHITGISNRRFLPNIQRIRVRQGGGVVVRKICASCIKAGKVAKA